jgi:hypothetical protein
MAKSKKCVLPKSRLSTFWTHFLVFSHTNHNQNKKAHRNGIKKPKSAGRTRSLKGVRWQFALFHLDDTDHALRSLGRCKGTDLLLTLCWLASLNPAPSSDATPCMRSTARLVLSRVLWCPIAHSTTAQSAGGTEGCIMIRSMVVRFSVS